MDSEKKSLSENGKNANAGKTKRKSRCLTQGLAEAINILKEKRQGIRINHPIYWKNWWKFVKSCFLRISKEDSEDLGRNLF